MKLYSFFLLAIALYCTSCHYLKEKKEVDTQLRLMQEQQTLMREGLFRDLKEIRRWTIRSDGYRDDEYKKVRALADSLYVRHQKMTELLFAVKEQDNESWEGYWQTVQAALENYKQLGHELPIIDNFHLDHQVFKEDMDLLNWKRDELSAMLFLSHLNTQASNCLKGLYEMVAGCGPVFIYNFCQSYASVEKTVNGYYQYSVVIESKKVEAEGDHVIKVFYDPFEIGSLEPSFEPEKLEQKQIGKALFVTFQSKQLVEKLFFDGSGSVLFKPNTIPFLLGDEPEYEFSAVGEMEVAVLQEPKIKAGK